MGVLDGWRYCPRCGGGLVRGAGNVRCTACRWRFWASSQPTAGALVVDAGGRVLLARRATGGVYGGFWDLPGGFLEEGEDPVAALRRELREETGLEIEPERLLGAWTDWYGEDPDADGVPATLNLYWIARVAGGELRPDDDVSELRWFSPDELPPREEIAFRNVAGALDAWRRQP